MKHLLSELVSYASLAKLFLGGLLHKFGSFLYTKYKAAKAEAGKLAQDVKKAL